MFGIGTWKRDRQMIAQALPARATGHTSCSCPLRMASRVVSGPRPSCLSVQRARQRVPMLSLAPVALSLVHRARRQCRARWAVPFRASDWLDLFSAQRRRRCRGVESRGRNRASQRLKIAGPARSALGSFARMGESRHPMRLAALRSRTHPLSTLDRKLVADSRTLDESPPSPLRARAMPASFRLEFSSCIGIWVGLTWITSTQPGPERHRPSAGGT